MVGNEVLNAKAEELTAQLTEWARESNILAPGQVLVFSLRVEQGPVVRRDESGRVPDKLAPSAQMCVHHDFIRPARLADKQIEELLGKIPENSRDALAALLKGNQNAPLLLWSKGETKYELHLDSVNNNLRSYPIRGKYYRLIRQSSGEPPDHKYWCQLWEVRQKAK